MRTFTTNGQSLIDSDAKIVSWLFTVKDEDGTEEYYWSTKYKDWGSQVYSDVNSTDSTLNNLVLDFTPLKLKRGSPENNVFAPSILGMVVSNPSNLLDPADFEGHTVEVQCVIDHPDYTEEAVAKWEFVIKEAWTVYQKLHFRCVDWLMYYLEGDYPNTPLISTLWPTANIPNDNRCVPKIFAEAIIPIPWTKPSPTEDSLYVLGEYIAGETHIIDTVWGPRETGHQNVSFSAAETDFDIIVTENTTADDGNEYATLMLDITGSGDNNVWSSGSGGYFASPSCEYKNTLTMDMKNPIEITKEILEDFGIPSAKIDTTSYNAAKAVWDGPTAGTHNLDLEAGFYLKENRASVLNRMLLHGAAHIVCRDALHIIVNDSDSVATIDDSDILGSGEGEGSFTYTPGSTTQNKDSGHVLFKESDKPQTDLIKLLISGVDSGATSNISNITIELPYVQDSQEAQRLGILALERIIKAKGKASMLLKSCNLGIEPGDVITISGANYNATATAGKKVLVDSVEIQKDLVINLTATVMSEDLREWDDLTEAAVTVVDEDITTAFYPVYAGTATAGSGDNLNEVKSSIRMIEGADITFIGDDSDPGELKWEGSSYTTTYTASTSGSVHLCAPDTDNVVDLHFGVAPGYRFNDILLQAGNQGGLVINDADGTEIAYIQVTDSSDSTPIEAYVMASYNSGDPEVVMCVGDGNALHKVIMNFDYLGPTVNKQMDLASATIAWDDVYCDDVQDVADFYYMDSVAINGEVCAINDIDVIESIKPSKKRDKRTGLLLIDDDTLPEWLLSKSKKTRNILKNSEGKPYLSLKTMISLCMGAIRKLHSFIKNINNSILNIEKRVDKLEEKLRKD